MNLLFLKASRLILSLSLALVVSGVVADGLKVTSEIGLRFLLR